MIERDGSHHIHTGLFGGLAQCGNGRAVHGLRKFGDARTHNAQFVSGSEHLREHDHVRTVKAGLTNHGDGLDNVRRRVTQFAFKLRQRNLRHCSVLLQDLLGAGELHGLDALETISEFRPGMPIE